jgi:hypothetical protein
VAVIALNAKSWCRPDWRRPRGSETNSRRRGWRAPPPIGIARRCRPPHGDNPDARFQFSILYDAGVGFAVANTTIYGGLP